MFLWLWAPVTYSGPVQEKNTRLPFSFLRDPPPPFSFGSRLSQDAAPEQPALYGCSAVDCMIPWYAFLSFHSSNARRARSNSICTLCENPSRAVGNKLRRVVCTRTRAAASGSPVSSNRTRPPVSTPTARARDLETTLLPSAGVMRAHPTRRRSSASKAAKSASSKALGAGPRVASFPCTTLERSPLQSRAVCPVAPHAAHLMAAIVNVVRRFGHLE
jgi:hypothetical protein